MTDPCRPLPPEHSWTPCAPGCPGWGVFNGIEIQKCDACARFATDDEAIAHVLELERTAVPCDPAPESATSSWEARVLHLPCTPSSIDWHGPDDDPKSYGLVPVQILGVLHHLAFIAVTLEDGSQVAAHSDYETELENLTGLTVPDGTWDTIELDGRSYVAYLHPYT